MMKVYVYNTLYLVVATGNHDGPFWGGNSILLKQASIVDLNAAEFIGVKLFNNFAGS